MIISIWIVPSADRIWGQNATMQMPVELFPLSENPFGLPYEDHVKNFWKLYLSIPTDENPLEDRTGEKCNYRQNGSNTIFYLTGNSGGETIKTCQVPAGLGLFIPIIVVEASLAESADATIDDLHKIAKNDQDHVTTLYLKINDIEFTQEDLLKYRTHTKDAFEVTFPDNAIFGAAPGPSQAVADGYYLITKPLSPGNYDIEFSGSIACLEADCIEPSFITQNIYHLVVQ